ncbi:MAG: hypothetical protein M1819_006850 [Sarea resinae]|nr:MAG: hypothetical protein M1819_006850 [Sarea resinae]
MTTAFTSIPIVDLSLANSASTKPQLLSQLRHALIDIGFLYVSNHGVPDLVVDSLVSSLPALFGLPQDQKDAISLWNSPQFLGYGLMGEERTAKVPDRREQFEFATELEDRYVEGKGQPLYERIYGPNQWPSSLPSLRPIIETYIEEVTNLSVRFLSLVAEALDLPPAVFHPFLSPQHRIKLLHYEARTPSASLPSPPSTPTLDASFQGVGAHKDSSGWWTFLLQASPPDIKGLQALNKAGEWIDVPVIPGTFVVNIGQAFEVVANGVCKATTHRVLSGPQERYSVPLFQGVRGDLTKKDMEGLWSHFGRGMVASTEDSSQSPFVASKESEEGSRIDSAFMKGKYDTWGESQLRTMIRSHPAVGRKFYGEVCEKYLNDDR